MEQLTAGRCRVLERMSAAEIAERIKQLQTELGRRFGQESETVLLIGDLPVPAEFRGTADTGPRAGISAGSMSDFPSEVS